MSDPDQQYFFALARESATGPVRLTAIVLEKIARVDQTPSSVRTIFDEVRLKIVAANDPIHGDIFVATVQVAAPDLYRALGSYFSRSMVSSGETAWKWRQTFQQIAQPVGFIHIFQDHPTREQVSKKAESLMSLDWNGRPAV